jgi:hypothetical protein
MATSAGASIYTNTTAKVLKRTVTVVVFVIAALSFAFGFGNGWQIGLSLGVPGWIAPLTAPAVDLSVVALLASVQFLRAHGVGGRLAGPRLLLVGCGLITFALNTARPLSQGQYGTACFDAVAPLLLIGWSEVGPRLLALLHGTVPDIPRLVLPLPAVVPDGNGTVPTGPELPSELVGQARAADADYRAAHERSITRDELRKRLRVSNAVAGALLRKLRG